LPYVTHAQTHSRGQIVKNESLRDFSVLHAGGDDKPSLLAKINDNQV